METWKIEMNRLNKMRLDLGLNWNQFSKIAGKNRELLKKYFEFRSVPSMKVYFELKIALENEIEVKFGDVEMVIIQKPMGNGPTEANIIFPPTMTTALPPKTPTRNTNDNSCDCKLENGLLKRGKIKCKKTKAEHKF